MEADNSLIFPPVADIKDITQIFAVINIWRDSTPVE